MELQHVKKLRQKSMNGYQVLATAATAINTCTAVETNQHRKKTPQLRDRNIPQNSHVIHICKLGVIIQSLVHVPVPGVSCNT